MYYMYKVGWYNSYADKETYSQGIVFAEDYSVAATRVINAYGKDAVFDIYLKDVSSGEDDYCLDKEDMQYIFKEKE